MEIITYRRAFVWVDQHRQGLVLLADISRGGGRGEIQHSQGVKLQSRDNSGNFILARSSEISCGGG
jgi:hypothetical protein